MNRYVKIREIDVVGGLTRWVPVEEIASEVSQDRLRDDPDPTLGADLKLNNHRVVGQLKDETLVIDGGLL